MEVKAEAPKSQMFTPKSEDSEAFRTDTKNLEFDLEALLAETANELAQAVAEETESESKEEVQEEAAGTEEVSEETESEAEDTDASGRTGSCSKCFCTRGNGRRRCEGNRAGYRITCTGSCKSSYCGRQFKSSAF